MDEYKKLSEYPSLTVPELDATLHIVTLNGSTLSNSKLPINSVFYDGLDSTSAFMALTAKQGKILEDSKASLVGNNVFTGNQNISGTIYASGTIQTNNDFAIRKDKYISVIDENGVSSFAFLTDNFKYFDGIASNVQSQINAKAPIASPTFSGNISLSTIAGNFICNSVNTPYAKLQYLNNVTSDINASLTDKVSSSQLTSALSLKANVSGQLFTGLVSGPSASFDTIAANSSITVPTATLPSQAVNLSQLNGRALLNGGNSFTGNQYFGGAITALNASWFQNDVRVDGSFLLNKDQDVEFSDATSMKMSKLFMLKDVTSDIQAQLNGKLSTVGDNVITGSLNVYGALLAASMATPSINISDNLSIQGSADIEMQSTSDIVVQDPNAFNGEFTVPSRNLRELSDWTGSLTLIVTQSGTSDGGVNVIRDTVRTNSDTLYLIRNGVGTYTLQVQGLAPGDYPQFIPTGKFPRLMNQGNIIMDSGSAGIIRITDYDPGYIEFQTNLVVASTTTGEISVGAPADGILADTLLDIKFY